MADEALTTQAALRDLVPRPDPTALTATAVSQAKDDLRRELASQKEILEARIARNESAVREAATERRNEIANAVTSLESLLTQRIAGLEQIMKILDRVVNSGPEERDDLRERLQTDIAVAVDNLKHLHEERFSAIAQQFAERDVRSEQEKKASKEALDAALLAQKESVKQQNDANTTAANLAGSNSTKQIDLVGTQITALDKSLTDRISELKERIDRGEGQGQGAASGRTERRLDVGAVVAAVAVLVAIISIIVVAFKK